MGIAAFHPSYGLHVVVAGAVAVLVPPGQSLTISVVDQSSGCLGENRDWRINITRAELMGLGMYAF
jgi:hypothetical protein